MTSKLPAEVAVRDYWYRPILCLDLFLSIMTPFLQGASKSHGFVRHNSHREHIVLTLVINKWELPSSLQMLLAFVSCVW